MPGVPTIAIPHKALQLLLAPGGWLRHTPPAGLLAIANRVVPEMIGRHSLGGGSSRRFSAADESAIDELSAGFIEADVRSVFHSLSALMLAELVELAHPIIPSFIAQEHTKVDHVGLEIFGKLEWYIELIERVKDELPLEYLRYLIFPSVQVRRSLSSDPNLGDVRIARIYFRQDGREFNLELFEVEQAWQFPASRQMHLLGEMTTSRERVTLWTQQRAHGELPLPVSHVAFLIPQWREMERLHYALVEAAEQPGAQFTMFSRELVFNPGDMSANTKVILQTEGADGMRLRNRILELVFYGDRRATPRVPSAKKPLVP
jgi:hypothetical protein